MYEFDFATPDDNFITRYVRYASLRTDASWDFHEAAACWILGVCGKRIRGRFVQYVNGIPTNLYIMLVGTTTRSRKTTSLNIANAIVKEAIPGASLEDKMSPEALVEQMALKGETPAAWTPDEFNFLFKSIAHKSHMKDFGELIMRLYDGNDYEVARHSKRIKGGDKEEDREILVKPHLSILAGTTESIFSTLTHDNLDSGLLPRFAIVMPTTKPPYKPFADSDEKLEAEADKLHAELVEWVSSIYTFLNRTPVVCFTREAKACVDEFSEGEPLVETAGSKMIRRLEAMLLKVAMIVAVGNPTLFDQTTDVVVGEPEMRCAMKIVGKWRGYAMAFADRIAENLFENNVTRGLEMVQASGTIRRDQFARHVKVPHNVLQSVIDTLITRGQVRMVGGDGPHPILQNVNGKPHDLGEVRA